MLPTVKSFGTEGRKQDGPQIPPSSEVYDVVSFRGSDIKDLTVLQSPVGGSTPNQAPAAEAVSQVDPCVLDKRKRGGSVGFPTEHVTDLAFP